MDQDSVSGQAGVDFEVESLRAEDCSLKHCPMQMRTNTEALHQAGESETGI